MRRMASQGSWRQLQDQGLELSVLVLIQQNLGIGEGEVPFTFAVHVASEAAIHHQDLLCDPIRCEGRVIPVAVTLVDGKGLTPSLALFHHKDAGNLASWDISA